MAIKNIKCILVLYVVMLISSCATENKPIKIVYHVPEIKLPPIPNAATNKLSDKSTPAEIMKAWVATATAYRGWSLTVKKMIDDSTSEYVKQS